MIERNFWEIVKSATRSLVISMARGLKIWDPVNTYIDPEVEEALATLGADTIVWQYAGKSEIPGPCPTEAQHLDLIYYPDLDMVFRLIKHHHPGSTAFMNEAETDYLALVGSMEEALMSFPLAVTVAYITFEDPGINENLKL